ncbi:Acyl-CoA dehydrogenase [Jatrophihabitans endophyticus]|uniref:Acyl-CoA dehydrogenase n=1 Tax=Jatrophihabitans endophyticus TaxID=1206085 RepID=A0A1M5CQ25_9ACTN|nr:acyl-CoA dehydrogenase family protein [Jatrophihabitans endophyticus]SHF56786.1 Acyl-CoA dehydrogenase [Jatrophihabitans endophyticus]
MIDFELDPAEVDLREEVRALLAAEPLAGLLAALPAGGAEPDVRALYRELGERGLLATGWPVEFGGRGVSHAHAGAVVEELVLHGVPDMLQVLSVQIVGLFVLRAGSAEQRASLLPDLGGGRRFATVLYTEPEVGSDLASLELRAERDGDDYVLDGVKIWGLKSRFADVGLCAARTATGTSRYEGISLFLVDLDSPGVERANVASIADDQFDRVTFRGVRVPASDRLGEDGDGWALLAECLALERTGLDYSLKARRWFDTAVAGVTADALTPADLASVGRHATTVDAAGLLAWDSLNRLDRGGLDAPDAAAAKLYTSTVAQDVAVWAAELHGGDYARHALDAGPRAVLDAAFREAPGVTIAAGTSQVLAEVVFSAAVDAFSAGESR